jgi:hypothetical protein
MRCVRLHILATLVLVGVLSICLPLTVSATVSVQRSVAARGTPPKGQITAWATYPLPGRGGRQIIHVRVVDEFGRGVSGAPVRIMVRDGASARIYGAMTGSTGYGRISFPIGHVLPGYTVLVHVTTQYQGQVLQTFTRYTPYY